METNKKLLEGCKENLSKIAQSPLASVQEKELASRLSETITFILRRPGTFEGLSVKDLIVVVRSRWYNHYHIKDNQGKLLYYSQEEFSELWELSVPMLKKGFDLSEEVPIPNLSQEVAHAQA